MSVPNFIIDIRFLDYFTRDDLYLFVQRVFSATHPGDVFVKSLAVEAMCSELSWMIDSGRSDPEKNNKLIINLPPRSLKSLVCSVAYPLFVLGREPSRKIISITYGDDLTKELADARRRIVEAPFFRRLYPDVKLTKNIVNEIRTSRGGYIIGTSVGGTLTGRGADEFIVDDPIKAADAYSRAKRESVNNWLRSTLASRPNNKRNARIILVMQRLHVDDPTGSLMATGQYRRLKIAAIAKGGETLCLMYDREYTRAPDEVLDPEREPLPVLKVLEREMTEPVFAAQYQQEPVPPEGGLFKIRSFQRYYVLPQREPSDTILQSWDTALSEKETADYSVGTTWLIRGDCYYLLDLVRGRFSFPELVKRVRATKAKYPNAHIVVENSASGISLRQQLRAEHIGSIATQPTEDKVVRAHRITPVLEAERIFVPSKAPWLEAFMNEFAAFPNNGSHDDQVDSVCQAINWWEKRKLQDSTALFGYY